MDKKQEAIQKRLKQYSSGKWEEVNSVIAEHNSLFDEGEIDFSKAIKGIVKRLRKIGT